MTILDAYAIVAFLLGGRAAPQVRTILRDGDAAVTTANLAEALYVSERRERVPVERVMQILDPLLGTAISVLPLDLHLSRRAAEIRVIHYNRSTRPISLADAILIASAAGEDLIATADADVLAVASAERIRTVPLNQERPHDR